MTDPSDGFLKHVLGVKYFTRETAGHQLLNDLGHAGIGLLAAGPAGWLLLRFGIGLSTLAWLLPLIGLVPTSIREVVQTVQTDSPHVFDRWRDACGGAWGGLVAWCGWAIYTWATSA